MHATARRRDNAGPESASHAATQARRARDPRACVAEHDDVAVGWTGRRDDQQRRIASPVTGISDVLVARPLARGGVGEREPDALKPRWGVEQRDLFELDAPAPEIAGEHPFRRYCKLGERSVPLSPGRLGRVGEIPAFDHRAMLPAAVSRVGRPIQRIGVVGDVAIEAGVNDAGVHVEPGH
jgi:hypothetical protein